jgi:hypothetical protein
MLTARAWRRYERRSQACLFVWRYAAQKWKSQPKLAYQISVDFLREAGFWQRNPRYPAHERLYYEDLLHLEDQALNLYVRLNREHKLLDK